MIQYNIQYIVNFCVLMITCFLSSPLLLERRRQTTSLCRWRLLTCWWRWWWCPSLPSSSPPASGGTERSSAWSEHLWTSCWLQHPSCTSAALHWTGLCVRKTDDGGIWTSVLGFDKLRSFQRCLSYSEMYIWNLKKHSFNARVIERTHPRHCTWT